MKDTFRAEDGGAEGIRTPDPHNAIVVLYQLSYDPIQDSGMFEKIVSGRKIKSSAKGLPADANEN